MDVLRFEELRDEWLRLGEECRKLEEECIEAEEEMLKSKFEEEASVKRYLKLSDRLTECRVERDKVVRNAFS